MLWGSPGHKERTRAESRAHSTTPGPYRQPDVWVKTLPADSNPSLLSHLQSFGFPNRGFRYWGKESNLLPFQVPNPQNLKVHKNSYFKPLSVGVICYNSNQNTAPSPRTHSFKTLSNRHFFFFFSSRDLRERKLCMAQLLRSVSYKLFPSRCFGWSDNYINIKQSNRGKM